MSKPENPSALDARYVELVDRFNQAVAAAQPEIAARLELGQQFNAYEDADNDEDGTPDWWEYHLSLGPIHNHRRLTTIEGEASAMLIEAGLKLAAYVANHTERSKADPA